MISKRTLSKLKKMPPREVAARLAEKAHCAVERIAYRWRTGDSVDRFAAVDPTRLLAHSRTLVPGTGAGELQACAASWPQWRSRLRRDLQERATRIIGDQWYMLGRRFVLSPPIAWNKDPRTGKQFEQMFYTDVDLHQSSDDGIDVKYIWELGRQQYCSELARAWQMTGNEEYARHCRRLILSWVEDNPLYEGVHWTSALEVAMRSISWIWSLAALADWDGWKESDLRTIAGSLYDHAIYLRHHFSFYSSPYNHLMGEATGLYLIASALPRSSQTEQWRTYARDVLAEYGPRQFYQDGFTVEQATGYHFYTLGFLAMALLAARNNNEPLPELETVVHRAFRAGAAMRRPDGLWPAIGDVDSARSIPVHPDEFWNFGSLCSLAAVMFDDPELKAASDSPGQELFWLLGTDGVRAWHGLDIAEPPANTLLPESGYLIARSDDDWLLFDAGPIAHGLHADATPSTTHGHADVFQVLFCRNKRPLLVDSGMPFYSGDSRWIQHFRSAAAHNTIEIEGTGPVRPSGRLDWSHVAPDPVLDAPLRGPVHLATGRAQWPGGVHVERHILWIPDHGLWIADWIALRKPRTITWHWQLTDDIVVASRRDDAADIDIGDPHPFVLAGWSPGGEIVFRLVSADKDDPAGWRAPGYGTRLPGRRASYQTQVPESTLVVTHIGLCLDAIVQYRGFNVGCRHGSAISDDHSFEDAPQSGEMKWTIGRGDQAQTIRVAFGDHKSLNFTADANSIPCAFS